MFDKAIPHNVNPAHNGQQGTRHRGSVVIPCVRGESETTHKILTKHGITVQFKHQNTLCSPPVALKDKTSFHICSCTVYQITCNDCSSAYMVECLGDQLENGSKNIKNPVLLTPLNEHAKVGHKIDWDSV